MTLSPKDADLAIRGVTTEAVLRAIESDPEADARALVAALVRRFDRKADRRARKAEAAA